MALGPPALELEAVSVWYQGEDQPALRDVSLSISPGERVLLLGASGSGKSTLALVLNGLIPRSFGARMDGRVLIDGRPSGELASGKLCQRVGVLFQDPETQFCMLSVADEVAFGLENLGVPPVEMPERIAEALRLVGLAGWEAARGDQLSGGMKQRLALGAILAMRPEVLVLDEPTANLDPVGTRSVFDVVAELVRDRRRTLIVIEHKLDACIELMDRVIVLDRAGRIIADGTPRETFARLADQPEQLGIWQPSAARLAHRLRARGVELQPFPLTVAEAEETLIAHGAGPELVLDELPAPVEPVGSSAPPALAISRLSFAYGPREVLSRIELTLAVGHLLAVVGPNGAGKTTLTQLAAGLRRAPPTTVRLFGRDVGDYPPGELTATVGYVFQNPEHQFIRPTVFDEVAFGLERSGYSSSDVRARVEELLA
jgi:energy-coupling factor transport system ATP-binding protein